MQSRRGLPSHPSLPAAPHLQHSHAHHVAQNSTYAAGSSYNAYNAQYAQPPYTMASHYAQAYAQHYPQPGWPNTTPQGYTLSSTYTNQSTSGSVQASFQSRPSGQWYQPGSVRCSKPGCQFTGSQKAVETHMMDRHLIYPPGWEKRKKKPDWDADPSLKGKPILIQGTNIKLDTPEAIEAWMAERKKRFPTAQKVEEKQQKLDEAIARGQLSVDDPRFPKQKRRRVEHEGEYGGDRGRGRGRGRGKGTDRGWRGRGGGTAHPVQSHPLPPKPSSDVKPSQEDTLPTKQLGEESSPSDDSDSDGAPEVLSSKAPVNVQGQSMMDVDGTEPSPSEQPSVETVSLPAVQQHPPRKLPPKQPRRPPHNPFASRPSLLRNLLLPEIRMTVSNLSQAIHFLVSNDFLDNVELKPGQASDRKIEVISETVNAPDDTQS